MSSCVILIPESGSNLSRVVINEPAIAGFLNKGEKA
jgi:hypothetical protein